LPCPKRGSATAGGLSFGSFEIERAFAELALAGFEAGAVPFISSNTDFHVVDGACVLRYDNEVGKGDHRHFDGRESNYNFTTPDRLIADFQRDMARWNNENRDS
jgi:hypothetical protein